MQALPYQVPQSNEETWLHASSGSPKSEIPCGIKVPKTGNSAPVVLGAQGRDKWLRNLCHTAVPEAVRTQTIASLWNH